MLHTLRTCLVLLGPGQRARWVGVLLLGLTVSGFEVVGALIVYELLQSITSGDSLFDLPILDDVSAGDGATDGDFAFVLVAVGIGAFFVLRGATILTQSYVESRVAENAGVRLASRLLSGYMAMPYWFHLERNSAELIRNTFDTAQLFVREALLPAIRLVNHSLISIGLVSVLLFTSASATVVALALLGPLTWILLRAIHPRVKRLGQTAQLMAKTSLQTLEETFAGWRDIKVLGRESFFVERFEADRRSFARARYLRSTARDVPRVAVETALVLVIIVYLVVSEAAGSGALEALPVLGLAGYVAVRLQPSINAIMVALNSLKFVGPGIDLINEDVRLFPAASAARAPVAPLSLSRELRLDAVTVRYPGAQVDALRDVDLTIAAGEFVGLVGPTGGGKTTLVDVILGLIEPTTGTVTIDGVNLRTHVEPWQAGLGVVHQMVFIADTTLRRNIALGIPEDEIDDDLLTEAVELAQLETLVRSLPDGLQTVVGERGARLSGGQRQRLAIARAFYRRPRVIVFDEGTSALDDNTEADLMSAVEVLRGDRTMIVVAHRLTSVAGCDRVVLVDGGRVVDVAPLEELIARNAQRLVASR